MTSTPDVSAVAQSSVPEGDTARGPIRPPRQWCGVRSPAVRSLSEPVGDHVIGERIAGHAEVAGGNLDVLGPGTPGLDAPMPLEDPIGAGDDRGDRHLQRTGSAPLPLRVPLAVEGRSQCHDLPNLGRLRDRDLATEAAADAPYLQADRSPVPI